MMSGLPTCATLPSTSISTSTTTLSFSLSLTCFRFSAFHISRTDIAATIRPRRTVSCLAGTTPTCTPKHLHARNRSQTLNTGRVETTWQMRDQYHSTHSHAARNHAFGVRQKIHYRRRRSSTTTPTVLSLPHPTATTFTPDLRQTSKTRLCSPPSSLYGRRLQRPRLHLSSITPTCDLASRRRCSPTNAPSSYTARTRRKHKTLMYSSSSPSS